MTNLLLFLILLALIVPTALTTALLVSIIRHVDNIVKSTKTDKT